MARLLLRALDLANYEAAVVSDLRSFSQEPNDLTLTRLMCEGAITRKRILEDFERTGRPDVWLSYHPFYKSPDLLGPAVAETLRIPYITVEASHAPKRNRDGWRSWQALTEQALHRGAIHFCLTQRDKIGIAALLGDAGRLIDLPPFLDIAPFAGSAAGRQSQGPVKLVTMAMMRPGDKLASYRFLAETLAADPSLPDWHLTIIGDGPVRDEVHAAFANLDLARLTWCGALEPDSVRAALSKAELYIWPGFGEAYGIAYLEAQAAGLPVLALDCGGISEVVRSGQTGILVSPNSAEVFASALRKMIDCRAELARMGEAARRFVHEERDIRRAAATLGAGIERVLR